MITAEMRDFFNYRTNMHINAVRKNLMCFEGYQGISHDTLKNIGLQHDQTKFSVSLIEPYILLTWHYKLKSQGIDFPMPEYVQAAWETHASLERHHPEFHESPDHMTLLDLIEMVCDWTSIAEELNECNGSAVCWYHKNVTENNKWYFSPQMSNKILHLILYLDNKKREIS